MQRKKGRMDIGCSYRALAPNATDVFRCKQQEPLSCINNQEINHLRGLDFKSRGKGSTGEVTKIWVLFSAVLWLCRALAVGFLLRVGVRWLLMSVRVKPENRNLKYLKWREWVTQVGEVPRRT